MQYIRLFFILLFIAGISGCSSIISGQLNTFSNNLSNAILNFDDPATVATATPTLLILIESFASQKDASASIQLTAAQMYGAYSGVFVAEPARQTKLSNRAFRYAKSGSCKQHKKWCGFDTFSNKNFDTLLGKLSKKDTTTAYAVAVAWLGYIQANSSNWSVIADLPKAKGLLNKLIVLDENYDNGGAHLYLGALESTLPQALGGKPKKAKAHFEKALSINPNNLLVKVEYARRYARGIFDKALHHRLLTEVIEADASSEGLTLMNNWAQSQAVLLLDEENEYFD